MIDRITIDSSMIRRYPTKLHVRCQACGHQAAVTTFITTPPKLKCSSCGNRNPVICSRDRLRTWATSRKGK